jgi:hypothetical protein
VTSLRSSSGRQNTTFSQKHRPTSFTNHIQPAELSQIRVQKVDISTNAGMRNDLLG